MKRESCQHKFIVDNHNIGTCSKCGEVHQFPLEKGGKVIVLKEGKAPKQQRRKKVNPHGNLYERSRYYEARKEEIIADLMSIGRPAACAKWNIPKGSQGKLERRWLTREQRDQITAAGIASISEESTPQTSGKNGRLPAFPEFSGTWEPQVQLKWLEVYEKLTTEVHNKE